MPPNKDFQPLIDLLISNGYKDLRVLSDGIIVGTIDLMYTRGLVIDLDWEGWGSRYCYADRGLASFACRSLVSGDDKPLIGYIAKRGR